MKVKRWAKSGDTTSKVYSKPTAKPPNTRPRSTTRRSITASIRTKGLPATVFARAMSVSPTSTATTSSPKVRAPWTIRATNASSATRCPVTTTRSGWVSTGWDSTYRPSSRASDVATGIRLPTKPPSTSGAPMPFRPLRSSTRTFIRTAGRRIIAMPTSPVRAATMPTPAVRWARKTTAIFKISPICV